MLNIGGVHNYEGLYTRCGTWCIIVAGYTGWNEFMERRVILSLFIIKRKYVYIEWAVIRCKSLRVDTAGDQT